MARIKDITFESGSLTGTNGADTATGTGIAIDSTSALKGTYSAKVNPSAATGYVAEDYTATDTIYVSFYLKITTNPSANMNILQFRTLAANIFNLRLTSAGGIQLLDSGGSTVGSAYSTSTNTAYRVGVRYTKGTGANAIIELFVALGDAAFGSAQASITTDTAVDQSARIRCGATSSATCNLFIDNIRVDDAAMPTDDVAGGTTYNQTISASGSNSVAVVKQVNRAIAITNVVTISFIKQSTHTVGVSLSNVVSAFKQVNKPISTTLGNVVPAIVKQINKPITTVVNSITRFVKLINKSMPIITAANVVIEYGLLFYYTINVVVNNIVSINTVIGRIYTMLITVNNAVNTNKAVNKVLDIITSITSTIQTTVNTLVRGTSGFGRNIGSISLRIKDAAIQILTGSNSQVISIDPDDKSTV